MTLARPSPLRTDPSSAFAHHSMLVRLPRIIRDVGKNDPSFAESIREDLERLAKALEGNFPIPMAGPATPNLDAWSAASREHPGETWLDAEWFYAELAAYREVIARVRFWETDSDPFRAPKDAELRGERLRERARLAIATGTSRTERIAARLDASLWANRVDLSHSAATSKDPSGDLLVDDRLTAVQLLAAPAPQLHVVADNAGTELSLDLMLLDAVLEDPRASATIHLKMEPIFVSDAMPRDVWRAVDMLQADPTTQNVAHRLRAAFAEGRLHLRPDFFWSSPSFLWRAPAYLLRTLENATVVLFKGDANYRRLVGDARWPTETPLSSAVDFLRMPLICARTMKSDSVLGLPAGLAARLDTSAPTWRTDGRRGLVQTWRPERAR